MKFSKKYDHKNESNIYQKWLDAGLFDPDKVSDIQSDYKGYFPNKGKNYSIPVPPPNINGSLHIGHSLMFSIEDILVRYHRMSGSRTTWIPGTDHAGIATQVKYESILRKTKGLTKHDISRADFLSGLWDFAMSNRKNILDAFSKIGGSVDWSREQFTMSEHVSRAVRKSFQNMYNAGKIYRGSRITNRCTSCQTVVSDAEVVMKPSKSKLYYIKYGYNNGQDYIAVATVRPETIFADVAIAVNPKDNRYKKLIGKTVMLPLCNRQIPVIGDPYVDMEFGTGALKITPGHDINDYNIGVTHNLPLDLSAIDLDGNFTDICGSDFAGKSVSKFTENVIILLEEKGDLLKTEEYENNTPCCERCGNKIEPLISTQRFADMDEYASRAHTAVSEDQVQIYPERFKSQMLNRYQNIQPRCISRQLIWGHRIPIWSDGQEHICITEDYIYEQYSSRSDDLDIVLTMIVFNLVADNRLEEVWSLDKLIDILTTPSLLAHRGYIYQSYLSDYKIKYSDKSDILEQIGKIKSALDNISDEANIDKLIDIITRSAYISIYKNSYKLDLEKLTDKTGLIQDSDVLDTWFSSGLWPLTTLGRPEKTIDMSDFYPHGVLTTGYEIIYMRVARMIMLGLAYTGQVPFHQVFFNGIVRDEKGVKMSKSLGNVVDPMEVIEQYGADAMRLSVITGITPGNDSNYSDDKTQYNYRFINKLWNASRFVYINTIGEEVDIKLSYDDMYRYISDHIDMQDSLNDFDLWILDKLNKIISLQSDSMSRYDLGEYAQELIQFVRHDVCDRYIEISKIQKSPNTDKVLLYVIGSVLKLLHPYIPFVTDQIYTQMGYDDQLSISALAQPISHISYSSYISVFMDMITEFRNLRNTNNIKQHELVEMYIKGNSEIQRLANKYKKFFVNILKASDIHIGSDIQDSDAYISAIVVDIGIGIKSVTQINRKTQIDLLQKELDKEQRFVQDLQNLIVSPGFVSSAPSQVVESKKQKLKEVKEKITLLEFEIQKIKVSH